MRDSNIFFCAFQSIKTFFLFLGNIPTTPDCLPATTIAPECDKLEQQPKQCLHDSPTQPARHDQPRSTTTTTTTTYTAASTEATTPNGNDQRAISAKEWKHDRREQPSAVSPVAGVHSTNATTTTQRQSRYQNARSCTTQQRIPPAAAEQKSGRSRASVTGSGYDGTGNRFHPNQSAEATRTPASSGSYSSCSANKPTNADVHSAQ